MHKLYFRRLIACCVLILTTSLAQAGSGGVVENVVGNIGGKIDVGGKLLGTSGVSSVDGGTGGGLLPWATLGGYATRDEIGASMFNGEARVDDYNLTVHGAAISLYDLVEVSVAHQDFYSAPLSQSIRQNIIGVKVRISGDLVYGTAPIISAGVQYKHLIDEAVTQLVGAEDDSGYEFYVAAAKAWVDGLFHRTSFLNINLRHSEANELGLLGFGGNNERSAWLVEGSGGLFITNHLALGVEFKQKRNHLAAFKEDHWRDVFMVWFPNKSVSVTAAYVDLGSIAGQDDQDGFYVSLQANF